MNQQEKEKLISAWLKGDIGEETLLESISREELDKYSAILDTVDNWEPHGRRHNESRLNEVLASKAQVEAKVVSMNRTNWFVGIAASIALLAAMAILFFAEEQVEYIAETENLEILLPDNTTTAILSPGSRLSLSGFDSGDRKVTIEGRVYFDVTEKGAFKVKYKEGVVSVLGTQFEVLAFQDLFETSCYEGKVMVEHRGKSTTLRRRERVAYAAGALQKSTTGQEAPGWLAQNEERFENDMLTKVIKVIETRYQVIVDASSISTNRRFTGSIPTNNLTEACKKVFLTLGINYEINEDKVILAE